MPHTFFATISRMKYIDRWALMRSSRNETLSEHSIEVAMIAHALCVIGNTRFGKDLDANKAALIGIYHDASEIITGDMPTPVKYHNKAIMDAYKIVEAEAENKLLSRLPESMRGTYKEIFTPTEDEQYMRGLVKAADKISAYIKCIEEEKSGNTEFKTAKESIYAAIINKCEEFPEVLVFVKDFLPAYGKTLDELNK